MKSTELLLVYSREQSGPFSSYGYFLPYDGLPCEATSAITVDSQSPVTAMEHKNDKRKHEIEKFLKPINLEWRSRVLQELSPNSSEGKPWRPICYYWQKTYGYASFCFTDQTAITWCLTHKAHALWVKCSVAYFHLDLLSHIAFKTYVQHHRNCIVSCTPGTEAHSWRCGRKRGGGKVPSVVYCRPW